MKHRKYKPDIILMFMSYLFAYVGSVTIVLKAIVVERGGFQFRAEGKIATILGVILILLSIFISNKFEKYYDEYMVENNLPRNTYFKNCSKYILVFILVSNYLIKLSSGKTVFYICHVVVLLLVIISMIMTEYNVSRKS